MTYTYRELEVRFEEKLTELYDEINICVYDYCAGHALKEVDPTAFRCGLLDWIDANDYIENLDGTFTDTNDDEE